MPDANRLRVSALGRARAWLGDEEVALGSARPRAVFAVLALRAGSTVSHTDLIEGVWGDDPPTTAEGSLYTYISGLRRAIEPGRAQGAPSQLLRSVSGGYRLELAPDDLDVCVFERRRAEGRRLAAAGDPVSALREFDEALALWHGEALTGIRGPFAEHERTRLGELRVDTQEQRIDVLLTHDRHAEVIAELTGLIDENPLREHLRAQLMLALYRAGRPAEALQVFQDARAFIAAELGIEPDAELRTLHHRILNNDPSLNLTEATADTATSMPAPRAATPPQVSRYQAMRTKHFVGRGRELTVLAERITTLTSSGRGGVVWIEGEPGIGKSELLTAILAEAERAGCEVALGVADELGQRFPLRTMFDCLGVDAHSPDPRRAELAKAVYAGDPVLTVVERLLGLVDGMCAQAPLVLAVDDLQWADEASLLTWHRLARGALQTPLLLVAATRTVPRRQEIEQLRLTAETSGGALLPLRPLPRRDVLQLVGRLVDGTPGPGLERVAGRAAGNPLYLQELIDVLVRERIVQRDGDNADVRSSAADAAPVTLAAAITRRLDFLDQATSEVLRWAALLGVEFDIHDVAQVTGRPPWSLLAQVEAAIAANVLADLGERFAFRHPLIRQALYDAMSPAVRDALHQQVARTLIAVGAPADRIADQLIAAPANAADWVIDWLVHSRDELSNRAPLVAADLLRRVLDATSIGDHRHEALAASLAGVEFRLGRTPVDLVQEVLTTTTDAHRAADMRRILAYLQYREGRPERTIATLREALADPAIPAGRQARLQALLSMFLMAGLADVEGGEAGEREALTMAERAGDQAATAAALQGLWQADSMRRRHASALSHVDRAIAVVSDSPEAADMHLELLDNRIFTLQNLDRLDEAERALAVAHELAARRGRSGGLHIPAAVHYYWVGRWDEALVELDSVVEDDPETGFFGLRERSSALFLLRGVAAMIAGHRADPAQAVVHLKAAENYPMATTADRENCDFYLVARAIVAEQQNRVDQALDALAPMLDPSYALMMLRHQWLPYVTRLALSIDDTDRARAALGVCRLEADKETPHARAWAAEQHCRGLLGDDPDTVLAAACHYRDVGRPVELAHALEDAAAVLAKRGETERASACYAEAATGYVRLHAVWDIERATERLARFGVHPAVPEIPGRRRSGPAALSAMERMVAELAARGNTNSGIATELLVSRSAVQIHVSRILDKLGVETRAEIAAALRED